MTRIFFTAVVAAAIAGAACGGARQTTAARATVRVAAASDLNAAMADVIARFSASRPIDVSVSYGSSGTFYAQLVNEAPFDMFFSADVDYPRRLQAAGYTLPDAEFVYGVGRLVLWVPAASRLDIVSPGEFLGYQPMSKRNPPPTDPGKPLCWMPQNVDNSSGGQTWVTSDRWGPFKDYMLHTSYGAAALLLVMQEKVEGVDQGGVWRFPFTFESGAMRARFRPQDGQLYVSGLRGWQTAGARDACLQRVRYTGKPVYMPSGINVHRNGIKLSFTCPLNKETAGDAGSYSILQWNYHWTAEYGSRQWSANDPARQGYDTLDVKSAKQLKLSVEADTPYNGGQVVLADAKVQK